MKSRIFNTLTLISAILLACTVILWAWSFWADPQVENLSFNESFHLAVFRGCAEFFNIKEYGPYHGSIIAVTSPERPIDSMVEQRGFDRIAGIYYCHVGRRDSGAVLWTLSVSLLYPLVVFAVMPAIWAWRWWRTWRRLPARQKEVGPRQQMRVAIRLYWWMGVLGTVVYMVAAFTICLRLVLGIEPPSLDNLGPLAICCLSLGVFAASIHVAHRLAAKPDGALPYARMVGIILATVWFPILAIPGIVCVRRVTRHFSAYCALVELGAGTDLPPQCDDASDVVTGKD